MIIPILHILTCREGVVDAADGSKIVNVLG